MPWRVRSLNNKVYEKTMKELLSDPKVQSMGKLTHHVCSTTLSHSIYVTKTACRLAKILHIRVHTKDLVRGCMLHDFYLYEFAKEDMTAYQHGTGHAAVALKNAGKRYDLTRIEQNMIYSHMWPLNVTHLPRYKESVLIVVADKYCAVVEYGRSLFRRQRRKQEYVA